MLRTTNQQNYAWYDVKHRKIGIEMHKSAPDYKSEIRMNI